MLKGTGNYEPHPTGQYNARCVDVVTMYGVETQYGTKNMIRVVFVTDAEPREGGGSRFISRRYNASIHPKSTLGQMLVGWRGRPFTPEEMRGFDEEKLVGVPALIAVGHRDKDGETYDQLLSVVQLPKGLKAPAIPIGFVRNKDKPENAKPPVAETVPLDEDDDAGEVPF